MRSRLALAAILLMVVSMADPVHASAQDPTTIAPCTPMSLPSSAAVDGEVMWIINSGLAVGSVATGDFVNGNEVTEASYWTYSDGGYQLHLLPNDPLVNDEVLDVNESGRMVDYGFSPADGVLETYVYDLPTDRWWHLANLGGSDTRGRRINASGVVAGGGALSNSAGAAATWSPPYTKVNTLPHVGWGSYANGINDAGTVVGSSNKQQYNPSIDDSVKHLGPHSYGPLLKPVQWSGRNGNPTVLPTLFSSANPFAINDAGTVVGSSDTPDYHIDSAYWVNGVVHDMGGRDGAFTSARGVSQGNWATGGSANFDGSAVQAFVWTGAGTLQYLPALDGPSGNSYAHGVNDHLGQVGGWSDHGTGHAPPTIWQCPSGFSTR